MIEADRRPCRQWPDRPRRRARCRADRQSGARPAVPLAGGQSRRPDPARIAARRLLRHAAVRRRAVLPGDRACGRSPGRRLHQEHRACRQVLRPDRVAAGAGPADHVHGVRRDRLPDAARRGVARGAVRDPPDRADRRIDGGGRADARRRPVGPGRGGAAQRRARPARALLQPHGQPDRAAAPRADRRQQGARHPPAAHRCGAGRRLGRRAERRRRRRRHAHQPLGARAAVAARGWRARAPADRRHAGAGAAGRAGGRAVRTA